VAHDAVVTESLVHPSVVEVNHHHQVSVFNHINNWSIVLSWLIVELEEVEEGIDDSFLNPGELGGGTLNREDHT
jgi:hypothetical protein